MTRRRLGWEITQVTMQHFQTNGRKKYFSNTREKKGGGGPLEGLCKNIYQGIIHRLENLHGTSDNSDVWYFPHTANHLHPHCTFVNQSIPHTNVSDMDVDTTIAVVCHVRCSDISIENY